MEDEARYVPVHTQHWKCCMPGCPSTAVSRSWRRVIPSGRSTLQKHAQTKCETHGSSMVPCSVDEFNARSTVH